jgi:hypothetical protein
LTIPVGVAAIATVNRHVGRPFDAARKQLKALPAKKLRSVRQNAALEPAARRAPLAHGSHFVLVDASEPPLYPGGRLRPASTESAAPAVARSGPRRFPRIR